MSRNRIVDDEGCLSDTHTEERDDGGLGRAAGFSLHCGVAAGAHQRAKLERLCRYIARPAIANERLSLIRQGNVRYRLKTRYRDGTTHVIFEPLDFASQKEKPRQLSPARPIAPDFVSVAIPDFPSRWGHYAAMVWGCL